MCPHIHGNGSDFTVPSSVGAIMKSLSMLGDTDLGVSILNLQVHKVLQSPHEMSFSKNSVSDKERNLPA